MKTALILGFILLLMSFHSRAQQTIDKLNTNQLKLPKESVSKALILDATGQVKSSSTVTDTEVGYLDGLTDTLVNLLSGKANDADVVKLSPNQTVSGIKTFDGKLVTSSTTNGSIPCPEMTQTQRNALTPANGECIYNSTSLKLNIYDGSVWKDVGGSGGISLWATSTGYSVNDVVIQSDKIYICLVAHTSGTFATDLSAAKWNEISKVSTIKSQGVSVSNLDELQIQNYQLTQAGTNKFYVESGNKNILANPSFEHSTFSTGWTNSAGTFTQELTSVIDGVAAAKLILSAQTMSLNQSSILYVGQFADGVQGLASVRVKSDVALKVCSMQNYIVSTTNCVDVQPNSKWGLYKVPFILGATSNGISIASTGAVTGTVYIDDAFVGAVDLKVDVPVIKSQYANLESTATFTGNVAITGALTNTNGSGLFSYDSGTGIYTALENIDVVMTVSCRASTATAGYCSIRTSNATQDDSETMNQAINSLVSAAKTFNIKKGGTFSAQKGISATSIDRAIVSVTATLEINSSVYSSTNADTDWASCGLTGASFTGFGSSVPTPELQCKRQGADLLIKGKFTAGTTPTAVEARMALPTWNGVQLVSAGSSVIPSIQLAGPAVLNFASTTYFGFNVLIEPSVAYTTFSLQTSSANGLTKQTGAAIALSGQVMSINARIPIQGWQGSNIIVGQFNGLESCTDTYQCTDTFSAFIDTSGNVSNENIDWINGNCTTSLGIFTCGLKTGLSGAGSNLTTGMNCNVTAGQASSTISFVATEVRSSTTTQIVYGTNNTTDFAHPVYISCQKGPSDFLSKTAKAVASDQNLSTPGIVKDTLVRVDFAGATIASQCTTTPCTLYSQRGGSWITSITRASAGNYTINLNASYWANPANVRCWINPNFIAWVSVDIPNSSGVAAITSRSNTGTYAAADSNGSLFCEGERL